MTRVLIAEAEPGLRGFVADALRAAGFEVDFISETRVRSGDLEQVDAVVADLGTAVRNGWVGEHGRKPGHARLVVTSPVKAFLEDVRAQADAVLATPATSEEVVETIVSHHVQLPTEAEPDPIALPSRQHTLVERGLYGARSDPELVAIAGLAARALGTKVGLVTLIDAQRQVFLGSHGLPADLAAAGGTPRSWSFCQHVVGSNAPLIVEDAQLHPTLSQSPLVQSGLVRSYAGVPVVLPGIGAIGAVCVVCDRPRSFDPGHIASLELAAQLASQRLEKIVRERPMEIRLGPTAPALLDQGDVLDGKYIVTARLGEGGQANVYLARDRLVGQLVAIKVQREGADPSIVREAKALAQLRHRSIVQLYGWGKLDDGTVYMVLEYVGGETLHRHLANLRHAGRAMKVAEVLDVARSLAGALATLHSVGRLHGDVKAANVMLDAALDRAVLIDFGLGVAIDGRTRVCGGTPGWSAPEQLDPAHVPIAAPALDAYSLACLSFAMLYGRPAFEGTRGEVIAAQRRGDFPCLEEARPELADALHDVFEQAFCPCPEDRFATPLVFVDALSSACGRRASIVSRLPPLAKPPETRGMVFRSTRETVRTLHGEPYEWQVFESVPPPSRMIFETACDDRALYPTAAFLDYLRAYSASDSAKLEALGELVAHQVAHHALRDLRVTHTPETILHVSAELLHRYHDWGQTNVRRTGPHSATLELIAPRELMPTFCNYFAGIVRGLIAAIRKHVSVEQSACLADHACKSDACVFDVRWAEQG